MQQLRQCVEKFVQKEAASRQVQQEDEDRSLAFGLAAVLISVLQLRQHRHVLDTLRRQFHDFLLVLRIVGLAAMRLMPASASAAFKSPGAIHDLPPVPPDCLISCEGADDPDGQAVDLAEVGEEDESARFLHDSLCERLLMRALAMLNTQQREELLDLKLAQASEVRVVLQSFCQLEVESIEKTVAQDVMEYQAQTKARLLADCDSQICEEQKQRASKVEEETALLIATYKREMEEEEQRVVKARRKWLTDRIVVIQAGSSQGPVERVMLQRHRDELRACETKMERYEAELERGGAIIAAPPQRSRPPSGGQRPQSASRRPPTGPRPPSSPSVVDACLAAKPPSPIAARKPPVIADSWTLLPSTPRARAVSPAQLLAAAPWSPANPARMQPHTQPEHLPARSASEPARWTGGELAPLRLPRTPTTPRGFSGHAGCAEVPAPTATLSASGGLRSMRTPPVLPPVTPRER